LKGKLLAELLAVGIIGEEVVGLTLQVAARVDDAAPERARLIPPEVGGVGPEHEEEGEGGAQNGEGQRRQGKTLDQRKW